MSDYPIYHNVARTVTSSGQIALIGEELRSKTNEAHDAWLGYYVFNTTGKY